MARGNPIQNDFSGGAVDARFYARQDLELYQKAALTMLNWMPMSAGSAARTPGTDFVFDIAQFSGVPAKQQRASRIFPFIDAGVAGARNQRVLLLLTDQKLQAVSGSAPISGTSGNRKQVMPNPEFENGAVDWNYDPPSYISNDGSRLGCRYTNTTGTGGLEAFCRNWKYDDNETCRVTGEATVDVPTTKFQLDFRFEYIGNPGEGGDEYTATLKVGTTPLGNEIGEEDLSDFGFGIVQATRFYDVAEYSGQIYITFDLSADEFFSTPLWIVDKIAVFADSDATIQDVELVSPYLAAELEDVQYLQSPLNNKEGVFVHPSHPPYWFYYDPDTDDYVMEEVPFKDVDGTAMTPGEWDVENYPSALTAYQGRLYLSGVPSDPEILWGSKVFDWEVLTNTTTVDPDTPPAPDSPVKFVTTFRGETRWMYGQKNLLVGADELEYSVSSESGVIAPGDIDARVQTTHGSAAVQPVGYGQYVAFAGDRGTRLRAFGLDRTNVGWLAEDKSVFAFDNLRSGIRRIVRMRNPHQMVVCVTKDGLLSILHEDTYANIQGWSQMNITAVVRDACVIPDEDGVDLLYLVVDRSINGQTATYLEVIRDWATERTWSYVVSGKRYSFEEPTNVITGLDHLNGARVQVVGDDGYCGTFEVVNGAVTLRQGPVPLAVNNAIVGLSMTSQLRTLPANVPSEAGGFGAAKRYSNVSIRGILSSHVIINGQRPPVRQPEWFMDISQPISLLVDVGVTNLGYDKYASVTIEENLPVKAELLAIYGTLTSDEI